MNAMLRWGAYSALVAALLGCDADFGARHPKPDLASHTVLNDAFTEASPALLVSTNLIGLDAEGRYATLQISWSLSDYGVSNLTPQSRVNLREFSAEGVGKVLASQAVSADIPNNEFELPIDVDVDSGKRLALELDRSTVSTTPGSNGFVAVNLAGILLPPETPLDRLQSAKLSLQADSYHSEIVNNRREHTFSASPETDDVVDIKTVSVTGLVNDGRRPFTVIESGVEDIESPLTVIAERQDPIIYMLMDISSSMVHGECWDDMLHAVSSTAITVRRAAEFKYYAFDSAVHPLNSLSEVAPIEGEASGSAL